MHVARMRHIRGASRPQPELLWPLCVLQLLSVERMNLYVSSIRVCFLLFESMRIHLKFQLEVSMHWLTFLSHWSLRVRLEGIADVC